MKLRHIGFAIGATAVGLLIAVTASVDADKTIAQADAFIASVDHYESEPETVSLSFEDWKNQRFTDYERGLLAYMVWGEISVCDNTQDYTGAYLQACVALNRLEQGWGDTLTEVIYADGQFCPDWYEQLMRDGNMPNATCYKAVDAAIYCNQSPENLLFADSRDTIPDGCYIYYTSPTGQRFYCLGERNDIY